MSLRLTLEQGPHAQAVRQTRLDQGELVIGRSPEADWQIEDPDMFVSRTHCRITAGESGYSVTDLSSSGLFIDEAASPLGSGNTVPLRNGMRLRLGDYVVCVELDIPTGEQPADHDSLPRRAPSGTPVSLGSDDFFSVRSEEEPQRPRPADLPNPFEQPEPGAFRAFERRADRSLSPAFDDPFSLDPVATPRSESDEAPEAAPWAETPAKVRHESPRQRSREEGNDFAFGTDAFSSSEATGGRRGSVTEEHSSRVPWDPPADLPRKRPAPHLTAPRQAAVHAPVRGAAEPALRAAFLRGLGVDEADYPSADPVAEMERFGRQYRIMMEGMMQLLRKRAEEKGSARVAQTVVGASEVNPLKFLPTVDDALATMLAERSPGFLPAEAAIADAVHDLAQHHIRAWRGLQGALRRMIDRFDPAAIEAELKSSSAIETILAGGRGAKLWELYQKRHREIATSAEQRFMGEIGADFRDAYEEE
ncbi:type VI secretion system-associated FHA domain protein TagH [Chelativorans salis]|uniref:Type VI secretion system-associated FHA domain protein TagH n=1 Tax=Chelativorans salis TaxID=2978478 RepID=A0ABT2LHU7_9HYPH|nr:type VI secretion system-associated FHA domain protein TagH [Chelativorans sp. EGI FJ00035]MCT7374141.1 type VI secretion system-associated FHA domain protein TagH [Chelativorans sp. EGI FJ00035]